jgi:hypothetical protein
MVTSVTRLLAWSTLALILVLPTIFFIVVSIMKYEMGMNEPFDSIAPFLENAGIKEFGFNINLLILFGPILAAFIALFQVFHLELKFEKKEFRANVTIYKRWFPLSIIIVSGMALLTLFLYMVGENCTC